VPENFKYLGIDLFSGAGGLSVGFRDAGIKTALAVDNWQDALSTFALNHPESQATLFDLGSGNLSPLLKSLPKVDCVFGGPPCQGFSIAGKRDPNDERNRLYLGFYKVVEHLKPAIFVMENVPNLISMDKGRIFEAIKRDFEELGYEIKYKVLLASDFGVPQNRRRLIMVGTSDGITFEFPQPTSSPPITASQAIGDLPEQSIEEGEEYPQDAQNAYQREMRLHSTGLYNHQTTSHAEKTVSIIALVPDGGNYKDLPPELRNTRRVNIAWTRFSSSKPSATIDTGHRHHFHYSFNRVPTVRESARLQSFPDDFIFLGSKTSQYKQVGNAVPPLLGRAIGASVAAALEQRNAL
jgi:DNA (cytosine-5)-methyltransferase 1